MSTSESKSKSKEWYPVVRVLILIAVLFAATYGSVAAMKIVFHTESPLMVVSSGSMIPVLNVGDIILVRGAAPTSITVGTIIIFHSPDDYSTPIVHRVIAIDHDGGLLLFETKGDNNAVPDNWRVPAANLMGIYVAKLPYVGLLSLELRGPLGIILIVLLVLLIVAVEYNESKTSAAKKAPGSAG
ncbi:MAG TPA: signal peptidase I [Terriglobales bacterium]|nr:signal peptidase I [Terriglobales bacterium]